MKLGLVQMNVCENKTKNLKTAAESVKKLAKQGAEIVVLPEMFCCPYENAAFTRECEAEGGMVTTALAEMARENRVILIGGSMPEEADGKLYNTSFVYDADGTRIARHRKAHLFDINVPNRQVFCESDTFTAGEEMTVFETNLGTFGLCICFDMRFPELTRVMALRGAQVIFCPAAFNNTTGPAHWEVMHRSRAIDNQLYVVSVAPAENPNASYQSYGHSIVVSPWGDVLAQADREECSFCVDIDLTKNDEIRKSLPLLSGLKPKLYENY